MNAVEVIVDDPTLFDEPRIVGYLQKDAGRRGDIVRFEYARNWLDRSGAFSIDPAR